MRRTCMLALIACIACSSENDGERNATTSTTADLTTASDPATSSAASTASSAATSSSSTDAVDDSSSSTNGTGLMCGSNDDCGDTEVCYDGQCIGAANVEYLAEVMYWIPADCGVLNSPDLYYALQYDDEVVITSGVAPDCPGVWTSFCMPAPMISVVTWFLLDDDVGSPSDSIDRLCWPEPTNPEATCLGFSEEVLHAGQYDGPTLNGHITVTFRPGC